MLNKQLSKLAHNFDKFSHFRNQHLYRYTSIKSISNTVESRKNVRSNLTHNHKSLMNKKKEKKKKKKGVNIKERISHKKIVQNHELFCDIPNTVKGNIESLKEENLHF